MHSRLLLGTILVASVMLLSGCENGAPGPMAPSGVEAGSTAAKPGSGGGNGGGKKLVGDVVVGDYPFPPGAATPIQSTCSVLAGTNWGLDYGHTMCLVVQPDWNPDSSFEPYALTDDVKLLTLKENGANGRITHVRLIGQDVIGAEGIQHNTDWIPVAVPVVPDRKGGTLHVHAPKVEIWRLSGHTGGSRVEMIGWISIGDAVYRQQ